MASFYSWKQIDDHFKITIKKNAVSQRINRMGSFSSFTMGTRLDGMPYGIQRKRCC